MRKGRSSSCSAIVTLAGAPCTDSASPHHGVSPGPVVHSLAVASVRVKRENLNSIGRSERASVARVRVKRALPAPLANLIPAGFAAGPPSVAPAPQSGSSPPPSGCQWPPLMARARPAGVGCQPERGPPRPGRGFKFAATFAGGVAVACRRAGRRCGARVPASKGMARGAPRRPPFTTALGRHCRRRVLQCSAFPYVPGPLALRRRA
jgi:hypothetical protein